MATATTLPTVSQDLQPARAPHGAGPERVRALLGARPNKVLRGRRIDSTPTLFPDVPANRDTGPDTLPPPGSVPERVGIARLALSSSLADAKHGAITVARARAISEQILV
jgi:hypothetical protein